MVPRRRGVAGMTELFQTALMITGFVLVMMLLIEYVNVLRGCRKIIFTN